MKYDRSPANLMPDRFYSLDAGRGIAALAIVFWHWRHFFIQGNVNFPLARLPLYDIFFVFYTNGFFAVPMFFSLSGFIFFWLYADKVRDKEISFRNFAVKRLSRLYPLHLLTLVIVAVGQSAMKWRSGTYFIYDHNDVYHFVLNLFFASYWGLQKGFSFNAPVWSVSVEVLMYIVFFCVCFAGLSRPWSTGLVVGLCLVMTRLEYNPELWWCALQFFSGGLVFMVYAVMRRRGLPRWPGVVLSILTLCFWAVTIAEIRFEFLARSFHYNPWAKNLYATILFLTTILTLVVVETRKAGFGRRLSILGDISYSMYLIHFPLQIFVFSVVYMIVGRADVFYSVPALVIFLCIVAAVSYVSHYYFERPVQRLIRRGFVKSSAASGPPEHTSVQ